MSIEFNGISVNTINPETGDEFIPIESAPPTLTAAQKQSNLRNDNLGEASAYHKRLEIMRPRSARSLYASHGDAISYTSDRGAITRMRLLLDPDYDIIAATSKTPVDISGQVEDLISDEGFTDFFVTNVSTTYAEKTQIMTTFGDNEVVYYFGKQPLVFAITGMLFDTIDNDWFSRFLTLYYTVLRGSELARTFSLIELTFPNMILIGTISALTTQQDSNRDTDINFSMQFVAKEVIPLPVSINKGPPPDDISKILLRFTADRTGITDLGIGTKTLGNGFLNSVVGSAGKPSDSVSSSNSALNSFRTNMFSPIFGIISSITKVVKTSKGSVSELVSSFTNPVNQVLRDVTNIATQASGLAQLSHQSAFKELGETFVNYRNTVAALKGAAGQIARVPQNCADNFKAFVRLGYVPPTSQVLVGGKDGTKSKASSLSSGTPYQPAKSNTL